MFVNGVWSKSWLADIYVFSAQRVSGPLRKSVNLKKGDVLEYRLFINI